MQLFDFLATHPVAWLFISICLGLMVGSFLNVVIYRIPVMLQRDWKTQCQMMLAEEKGEEFVEQPQERFNLAYPNSRCPSCEAPIKAWQNIPVISWLTLKGKCANCEAGISVRYPIIEAVTGTITGLIAWHFGFGWEAGLMMLLSWTLISLTMIDIDHQLLPDNITLPLLWLGLIANTFGAFTTLDQAIWGAIAGYMSLWSIYWLFKLVTGKEGMGYGDFKLLAALGAWLGWQALPMIILLSSLVGAVIGILLMFLKNQGKSVPIPFGPYLAIAGWIAAIWGEQITQAYLRYSGLA